MSRITIVSLASLLLAFGTHNANAGEGLLKRWKAKRSGTTHCCPVDTKWNCSADLLVFNSLTRCYRKLDGECCPDWTASTETLALEIAIGKTLRKLIEGDQVIRTCATYRKISTYCNGRSATWRYRRNYGGIPSTFSRTQFLFRSYSCNCSVTASNGSTTEDFPDTGTSFLSERAAMLICIGNAEEEAADDGYSIIESRDYGTCTSTVIPR